MKQNINIAILYYGRIKFYEKMFLFKAINNLESYNINIFYSTDIDVNINDLNDFCKLYNPSIIDISKIIYDVDLNKNYYHEKLATNIHNMTCHFINLKRSFMCLENYVKNNNIKYDIVISTRFDLYMKDLDLDKIMLDKGIKQNTLYIPNENDFCGTNDRLAIGDFESMKKYMYIIDNCTYLLENKLSFSHPESLTLANIIYNNLNIERFDLFHEIKR